MSAPPDGMEVELMAITMAAALGYAWNSLDDENVSRLRVCANAALIRQSFEGGVHAPLRLRAILDEAADALRAAAAMGDHMKAGEQFIQRVTRAAAQTEIVAAALGVMADVEPPEEAI